MGVPRADLCGGGPRARLPVRARMEELRLRRILARQRRQRRPRAERSAVRVSTISAVHERTVWDLCGEHLPEDESEWENVRAVAQARVQRRLRARGRAASLV